MPTIAFHAASAANYTVAHRPASARRLIVIHVTESSFSGAIAWFENPRAQASANYVVSQAGAITEMVADSDIAWQAGNWAVNRESIGIEHAGYTYVPGSFSDAEYRASAQLVAYEARHYVLPLDRRHIIGHDQVPDPNNPGEFGGFAHHTDPGRYWNWTRYMAYVRSYAQGNAPAPQFASAPQAQRPTAAPAITAHVTKAGRVQVSSSGLADAQAVAGFVRWAATVSSANVARVEFLVDGQLRWTEHEAPYVFGGDGGGWDTTRETNGPHVLTVRVVTRSGAVAGQSLRVTVANTPFAVSLAGVAKGQSVRGRVDWQAAPTGAAVDHVDFLVDGALAHTGTQAPYTVGWNAGAAANGSHTLTARAVASDGRVAEASVTVVVTDAAPTPAPRPPLISVVMKGVWDGERVSGRVDWEAVVAGGTPDRVEFLIDGVHRWTEHRAPYVFDGDGNTWDTSGETPGPHVLEVEALRGDGLVYDAQTFTVVVVPPGGSSGTAGPQPQPPPPAPPPAPLTVASSLTDGAAVGGTVHWVATVGGPTPGRVEYYVDGRLVHTERSSPYENWWDTTAVADGRHELALRAVAGGQEAWARLAVVVANARPLAVASQTLADGQTVSGSVPWQVATTGPVPDRVEFWIDGALRWTERQAPYVFDGDGHTWDTTSVANGPHRLTVRAVAGDAVASLAVVVANAAPPPPSPPPPPPPPPPPASAPTIVSQTLADGETLSGTATWTVVAAGDVRRVEFWIDGRRVWAERSAPYAFAGDGRLDTTRLEDGPHTLSVVVLGRDDASARADLRVTVANGSDG